MTVMELINKLGEMPPDAIVVYDLHSECSGMEDDWPRHEKMINRNGTYMELRRSWWNREIDGEPVLVDVCHFPGN